MYDGFVVIVDLMGFALIISLGGMKVIGYTDVIQVVFLIFGGLVTTYLALDKVAELKEKGIYCAPFGPSYVRFVTHLGFDDAALQAFTERISE
mgnify:CR=1 FL=1